MNRQALYVSALQSAAKRLGEERLRERLNVPPATLCEWLAGERPIPEAVFLRTVDVLQERAL
ncbi:MAG TPA: hypothetical protein VNH16_17605 [Burkholderiales bacterium]|jgi:hypothetical protein|nr:hypothetical protein [Burkholderiales bacterium]